MSNLDGTFRSYWGAIAVPILDKGNGQISNVTHDWANATAALSGGLAITIMRLSIRNHRVDLAKERLAEMAVANGCQFVLFIDDDVIPPADGLMKMIKLWKSDPKYKIITGVYWSKSDPPMPLLFNGNLEGSVWDWTTQDLIKVDGAGAGFLFVDTEVLKKLPKPWFSCDYFFDDPRTLYDVEKWGITDRLGAELLKPEPDKKLVADLEKQLQETGDKIRRAQAGEFDPNLLKNRHSDGNTTEDLYFFKKAKELGGYDLWADCSIQCWHQDKATGRMWGLQPDMPQARPRYEGRFKPGDKVVLDIGAGTSNYWVEDGRPIKIDNDPATNPDIVADARNLPLEDCFADKVMASHMLEHFSFRETVSVLKEWVRVLKIGGTLTIVVPNLKWASDKLLKGVDNQYDADRAMFMYNSAQRGNLQQAHQDFHKSGFTPESMLEVLNRIPGLEDVRVTTSEGNYGNYKEFEHEDGLGYNIIATAKKVKHQTSISLKLPLAMQDQAQYQIGDRAQAEAPQVKPVTGKIKHVDVSIKDGKISRAKAKPAKTKPAKKAVEDKKDTGKK